MNVFCKAGLHRWETDSGVCASVEACRSCGTPKNKEDAARRAREVELWKQVPRDLGPEEAIGWVFARYHEAR